MAASIQSVLRDSKKLKPYTIPSKELENSIGSHRNIWIKYPTVRDQVAKFCADYNSLSEEEQKELAKLEDKLILNRQLERPTASELYQQAMTSFKIFVRKPGHLEELTHDQGDNKHLAAFLAIDTVYNEIKPKQLLRSALYHEDDEDIKAIILFILANFGSNYSDADEEIKQRSANQMLVEVMAEFAGKDAKPQEYDFTPDTMDGEEKQRRLATLIVGTVLTKTNPHMLNEKLVISIAVAADYNPKNHWQHNRAMTTLKQFVRFVVVKIFNRTPPNFWIFDKRLKAEIDKKIQYRKTMAGMIRDIDGGNMAAAMYLTEIDRNRPEKRVEAKVKAENAGRRIRIRSGTSDWTMDKKFKKNVSSNGRYRDVVDKAIEIARDRHISLINFDAVVKKEEEIKRLMRTPIPNLERWEEPRPLWQPPYDGKYGYDWSSERDNPEGIPPEFNNFQTMLDPKGTKYHIPSYAMLLAKQKIAVADRFPDLRDQCAREIEQDHYMVAQEYGNDNSRKNTPYGPKTTISINLEQLRKELAEIDSIMDELVVCCETTGLYLSELQRIESQIGIRVTDLKRIVDVTGVKLSDLRKKAENEPCKYPCTGSEAAFLLLIIEAAQEAQKTVWDINLSALELPAALSNYPLWRLVNACTTTGFSLKQLDEIAETTGLDYSTVAPKAMEAAANDSELALRYFTLFVIREALKANMRIPRATLKIVRDNRLNELDPQIVPDIRKRNEVVKAFTLPPRPPKEDPDRQRIIIHVEKGDELYEKAEKPKYDVYEKYSNIEPERIHFVVMIDGNGKLRSGLTPAIFITGSRGGVIEPKVKKPKLSEEEEIDEFFNRFPEDEAETSSNGLELDSRPSQVGLFSHHSAAVKNSDPEPQIDESFQHFC